MAYVQENHLAHIYMYKLKSTMSRYFIKSFMQHGRRLLEDAGLGLFVPSGAERAYFRLPCTLHSSVPLLYKAAELVRIAVHIEIGIYIKSKHELGP